MNKKFTPGPWRFDSVDTPFELVNGECVGGEDTGIREVYQEDGSLPIATCYAIIGLNNTENARLIAAAPDLYEALEKITADYERLNAGVWADAGGVNVRDLPFDIPVPESIQKARAALAKANGEVMA